VKRLFIQFWKSKSFAVRLARMAVMLAAGFIITIMAFEDRFIYFPEKFPEGQWDIKTVAAEGQVVPVIEDCFFQTPDGVRLHGWFCAPGKGEQGAIAPVAAEMTLLWFHGNAGNITHRYGMIEMLVKLPANVFIIDYRGYGKSGGEPSEEGLYIDARAAWDYLTKDRRIAPDRIIIFGKSLGGVPAIDLASKSDAAGLIVQSSFSCAADMAQALMPFVPRAFIRTRMDSVGKIAGVKCPKLFIHSRSDEVVPFALGQKLFEAASDPKKFCEVKGAAHNDTYIIGGRAYFEDLREFILSCSSGSK
jgi:fermentation-respiration switch protein FrsA (DUF1100 family)